MLRHQTRNRVDALAGLHVLRHCDRHELDALATEVSQRRFEAGDAICRTGELADEVFFLAHGNLAVVADGQLVATLTPGSIAGELGPLGPSVRCADLIALTGADLFVVSAQGLRRLLSDSPGLRRGVTPVLADRADQNEQRARH